MSSTTLTDQGLTNTSDLNPFHPIPTDDPRSPEQILAVKLELLRDPAVFEAMLGLCLLRETWIENPNKDRTDNLTTTRAPIAVPVPVEDEQAARQMQSMKPSPDCKDCTSRANAGDPKICIFCRRKLGLLDLETVTGTTRMLCQPKASSNAPRAKKSKVKKREAESASPAKTKRRKTFWEDSNSTPNVTADQEKAANDGSGASTKNEVEEQVQISSQHAVNGVSGAPHDAGSGEKAESSTTGVRRSPRQRKLTNKAVASSSGV